MSSGGLLLLLGLLTLWAELTPVSGQDRPKFCYLPAVTGPCKAKMHRFHYNPSSNKCQDFTYGGCHGNANNFKTKEECQNTCVEKPGVCPKTPPGRNTICLAKCENDWKCSEKQKCCTLPFSRECMDPI